MACSGELPTAQLKPLVFFLFLVLASMLEFPCSFLLPASLSVVAFPRIVFLLKRHLSDPSFLNSCIFLSFMDAAPIRMLGLPGKRFSTPASTLHSHFPDSSRRIFRLFLSPPSVFYRFLNAAVGLTLPVILPPSLIEGLPLFFFLRS